MHVWRNHFYSNRRLIFAHFTTSICVINLEQLGYHICAFPCHNRSGFVGPPLSKPKEKILSCSHTQPSHFHWLAPCDRIISLVFPEKESWSDLILLNASACREECNAKNEALRVSYSFHRMVMNQVVPDKWGRYDPFLSDESSWPLSSEIRRRKGNKKRTCCRPHLNNKSFRIRCKTLPVQTAMHPGHRYNVLHITRPVVGRNETDKHALTKKRVMTRVNISKTSPISMANTNVCQWAGDEVKLLPRATLIFKDRRRRMGVAPFSSTLRVVLLDLRTQAQLPADVMRMPEIAANDSLCIYTTDVEARSTPST